MEDVRWPVHFEDLVWSDLDAMVRDLAERARRGTTSNPAQLWPSQRFASAPPAVERALDLAATRLLATSTDEEELRIGMHLGRSPEAARALMDRLLTDTLPAGELREQALASLCSGGMLSKDADAVRRLSAWLERHDLIESCVSLLAQSDPDGRLGALVEQYLATRSSPSAIVLGIAASALARGAHHADLLRIASRVGPLDVETRRRFASRARRGAGRRLRGIEQALLAALHLHPDELPSD